MRLFMEFVDDEEKLAVERLNEYIERAKIATGIKNESVKQMYPEIIDNINKPSHYQGRFGMESIDALRNFMTPEQLKGFYLGNALKYQLRFQKKNGLEDLKKARKNLDWLIEEMEHEN